LQLDDLAEVAAAQRMEHDHLVDAVHELRPELPLEGIQADGADLLLVPLLGEFVSPTPVLVVHGRADAYCSPQAAAAVYERLGEPRAIYWLPTSNHIELYDDERYVGPAVTRVAAWFDEHLAATRQPAPL
jgi:fermentation-respiration switch protein FrsA (DUF1100 family)